MSENETTGEVRPNTEGEKKLGEELDAVDREVNPHTGEEHGEPRGRDAERREIFKRLHGGEHQGEP